MFSNEPTAVSDEHSASQRDKERDASRRGRQNLELDPGTRLGRYEILGRLGAGSGGTVFAARDPDLGRDVALKVLSVTGKGAERRAARLLREGRALARLSHPNVVTVLDVGREGSLLWVAMHRIDGVTLTDWLREQRPRWNQIVDLFLAAGAGLAEAHRCGLVHRDFKPHNVMIEPDPRPGRGPRVLVMDFGLSRPDVDSKLDLGLAGDTPGIEAVVDAAQEVDGRITRDGAIVGTPFFMAPEQHLGQVASAAADQFAFCVALYSALFDRYPFAGERVSDYAVEVVAGRVRPPELGAVPRGIWTVIERGLSVQPSDRFTSMDAVLEALGRAKAGRRRNRVLVGVGALALLGLGSLAWFERPAGGAGQDTHACTRQVDTLASDWQGSLRSSLQQAHRNRGPGPSLTAELQTYVERYEAARQDICETSTVRPEAAACLHEAGMKLRGVLQAVNARSEVLERGLLALERLPEPSRCASTESMPPPSTVSVPELVDAHADLVTAQALLDGWQHQDALQLATQRAAWAVEHEALQVELQARAAVGTAQAELGDLPTAITTWSEVYDRAAQAKLDALAAQVALLITARALYRRDAEQAQHWIRNAQSLTEHLEDPQLQALVLAQTARLHQVRGELPESVEAAQSAVAIEPLATSYPLHHAALRANQAQIVATAGQIDPAIEILTEVIQTRERLIGAEDPGMAGLLVNRAVLRRSKSEPDQAAADLDRAVTLLEATGRRIHPHTATALLNLGVLASDRGEVEQAIGHLQESLQIHEELYGPDHGRVALILVNLGVLEVDRGQIEQARRYIDRGLTIYEANVSPSHHEFGQALVAKATILQKQGQVQAAHEAFARTLEQVQIPVWRVSAHLGLAETSTDPAQQRRHFQAALAEPGLETLLGQLRARALFGLAKVTDDRAEARALAQQALAAARSDTTRQSEAVQLEIETWLQAD